MFTYSLFNIQRDTALLNCRMFQSAMGLGYRLDDQRFGISFQAGDNIILFDTSFTPALWAIRFCMQSITGKNSWG